MALGKSYIKGVLDLVKITNNSVHIIDYKTGKPLSSLNTTSQTEGIRAWKHKLQLTYYALLAQESGLANTDQTISTEMIYVESEDVNKMRLQYTPSQEDIARLKKIIEGVCNHLHSVTFPDISVFTGRCTRN